MEDDYFCSVGQYELLDYHQHVPLPSCVAADLCIKHALRSPGDDAALAHPSCPTIAVTHTTDLSSPVSPVTTATAAALNTEPMTLPRSELVDAFFADVGNSGYPIYGHRSAAERLVAVREALAASHVTPQPRHYVCPPSTRILMTADAPAPAATQEAAHETHVNHTTQDTNNTTTQATGTVHDEDTPLTPPPHEASHTGAVLETGEQYWRRLARHYIQLGMTSSMAYEPDDAFYLVDLGRVITQMCRWRRALPMVRPYYAVKCNPSLAVLRVLAALGAGFDCASKQEMRLVMDHQLVQTPDDIIFANPCKQRGDLRVAHNLGVTYVTFDNVLELHKIAKEMPHARSVVRIRTDDGAARCSFSSKFGAPMDDVETLLRTARSLDVEIYGVSFHVGSGNSDVSAYVKAVRSARQIFDMAARYGFNCTLLDIGGGYPGMQEADEAVAAEVSDSNHSISASAVSSSSAAAAAAAVSHTATSSEVSFEEIAAALRPVLEELFPDTTIISEPGRFFTAAAMTLAMHVFARRTVRMTDVEKVRCQRKFPHVSLDSADVYQYYVNDGLYHSFNCIVYDHAHPKLLLLDDGDGAELHTCRRAAGQVEKEENTGREVSSVTTSSGAMIGDPWRRRRECARRPPRISTIFGPTCDSLDCILKTQPFPEMIPGDWVIALDMGSYTSAAGSAFNGFQTQRIAYVTSVLLD